MEKIILPSTFIPKNVINNTITNQEKLSPYKFQHFRQHQYKKKYRDQFLHQIHLQKIQQNQSQSINRDGSLSLEKDPKINFFQQQLKKTLKNVSIFSKPPVLKFFDKTKINHLQFSSPWIDSNPITSSMTKQSQIKFMSPKNLIQSKIFSKQRIFRSTFSTYSNCSPQSKSVSIKLNEKRPPTSSLQSYRPTTRIRKVSNIGDQNNSNFLSKYQIIKQLGKGTYGTVYLAKVLKKRQQSNQSISNNTVFISSKLFYDNNTQKSNPENQKNEVYQSQHLKLIPQNTSLTKQSENVVHQKSAAHNQNVQSITAIAQQSNSMQISGILDGQISSQQQSQINNSLKQNSGNNSQQNSPQDEELVAIKVYQKFKMNIDPSKFKNIRKQITIMQNLNHSGVIKLYQSVESITKISLVIQYAGEMSLLDYLKKNFPLTDQKLKNFSKQLLEIIIYLHSKNIVHRDIKPQNILVKVNKLTNCQSLKLIDYGFSTLTNKFRKLNVICGTPNFMAPELLNSKEYFGEKVDVWSYGVVVFVMAQGRHPFKSQQYQELTRIVNRGKYIFKKRHEPLFQQFISQILCVNSDLRPRAIQISKLKWISQQ